MADNVGNKKGHDYGIGVATPKYTCPIKGMDNVDWGMKNRLSHVFGEDGRTVMLAFDHGDIMGPTAGLERLDLSIPPLAEYADVLMGTRGALRFGLPATYQKGIALRCTAGSSVLKEEMSLEKIGVDIDDAIRMNAHIMAVQCFVGGEHECQSIENLCRTIDAGNRYNIATMGVTAVGKQMARTTQYFLLATRMLAEFGAHVIKTYYCEDFENVVAACPVPIVIAGGKKLPEDEALTMCYEAIQRGAAGVDMGRNVFQSLDPVAMIQAVRGVVHGNLKPNEADELFLDLTALNAKN